MRKLGQKSSHFKASWLPSKLNLSGLERERERGEGEGGGEKKKRYLYIFMVFTNHIF